MWVCSQTRLVSSAGRRVAVPLPSVRKAMRLCRQPRRTAERDQQGAFCAAWFTRRPPSSPIGFFGHNCLLGALSPARRAFTGAPSAADRNNRAPLTAPSSQAPALLHGRGRRRPVCCPADARGAGPRRGRWRPELAGRSQVGGMRPAPPLPRMKQRRRRPVRGSAAAEEAACRALIVFSVGISIATFLWVGPRVRHHGVVVSKEARHLLLGALPGLHDSFCTYLPIHLLVPL